MNDRYTRGSTQACIAAIALPSALLSDALQPYPDATMTVGLGAVGKIRVGRILSGIVVVLLFADAVAQLASLPMLRTEMTASSFPFALSPVLGTITMSGVLLYAFPRTATLGAILVTGFLGGAICMHQRLGEIGSPPQVICLLLGVVTWGGLYLRDPGLRAVLPLRS